MDSRHERSDTSDITGTFRAFTQMRLDERNPLGRQ
jgi:hypothetical protein